MYLRCRELSLWSTARVRAANLWKPVMPDLAWLYGAYAMMGQMGIAQPVVHRQHIHQQRAPGRSSQGGRGSRRNQRTRRTAQRSFSPPASLAQAPMTIGFNAPNHHIHQAGVAQPYLKPKSPSARPRPSCPAQLSQSGKIIHCCLAWCQWLQRL